MDAGDIAGPLDSGTSPVATLLVLFPAEREIVLNPIQVRGVAGPSEVVQIEIDGESRGAATALSNGTFSFDVPVLTVGDHRLQARSSRSVSELISFQVRADPQALKVGCACGGTNGELFLLSVLAWLRLRVTRRLHQRDAQEC